MTLAEMVIFALIIWLASELLAALAKRLILPPDREHGPLAGDRHGGEFGGAEIVKLADLRPDDGTEIGSDRRGLGGLADHDDDAETDGRA